MSALDIGPQRSTKMTERRYRILGVDDEPMLGTLLKRILRGHEVVFESDARAGLKRAVTVPTFDRIICDIEMPQFSGVDFFEELQLLDPEAATRVVFITGGAITLRAANFLHTTKNAVVHKPFSPHELIEALKLDGL